MRGYYNLPIIYRAAKRMKRFNATEIMKKTSFSITSVTRCLKLLAIMNIIKKDEKIKGRTYYNYIQKTD